MTLEANPAAIGRCPPRKWIHHQNIKHPMKLRNTIPHRAISALAVMTLTLMSANAAVVAPPAANDIFLGFRASGNLGASTSYLVDLGQYSQFRDAGWNATITLSLG